MKEDPQSEYPQSDEWLACRVGTLPQMVGTLRRRRRLHLVQRWVVTSTLR